MNERAAALAAVGIAVSVIAGVAVLGFRTVINAVRLVPKWSPFAARRRQVPLSLPRAAGALIGSEMSTTAPGAANGIGALPGPIARPPTKTIEYELSQAQSPLFFTLHVLTKGAPGATVLPSGNVTSATNVELGTQGTGVGGFVGGGTAVVKLVGAGVTVEMMAVVGVPVGVLDAVGASASAVGVCDEPSMPGTVRAQSRQISRARMPPPSAKIIARLGL